MRKHSKKFIIFLLIIIAIAGFFYIYSAIKMEKTYAFFKPLINIADLPSVKTAVDYSKKSVNKVGEKIKNQINAAENSVSKATDKFKNSAFEFTKENINSGLNTVGNVLGVDSNLVNTNTINESNISADNNKENCNQ